jgi:methionyl-tRNA formyltransferase
LERLADIGGKLLCDTMDAVEEGRTTRTPQDETKATYAPMLTKDMCPIDWSRSAREIIDHVRGLDPWPVATTMIQGKRFKIYAVRPVDRTTDKEPGTLLALTKTGLEIACGGGGVLVITVLQAEGGKRMAAPDYFRGHPITL